MLRLGLGPDVDGGVAVGGEGCAAVGGEGCAGVANGGPGRGPAIDGGVGSVAGGGCLLMKRRFLILSLLSSILIE